MFKFLSDLFASMRRLAENVNALANTVDEVNAGLRDRLGLPVPTQRQEGPPLLPEEVDHTRNGVLPPPPPAEERPIRKPRSKAEVPG